MAKRYKVWHFKLCLFLRSSEVLAHLSELVYNSTNILMHTSHTKFGLNPLDGFKLGTCSERINAFSGYCFIQCCSFELRALFWFVSIIYLGTGNFNRYEVGSSVWVTALTVSGPRCMYCVNSCVSVHRTNNRTLRVRDWEFGKGLGNLHWRKVHKCSVLERKREHLPHAQVRRSTVAV
jgi:hypothetical protein